MPSLTASHATKSTCTPPKKRLAQACAFCRRSHLVCDSGRPCQRCIKRKIEHLCFDEPPKDTDSGKSENVPKDTLLDPRIIGILDDSEAVLEALEKPMLEPLSPDKVQLYDHVTSFRRMEVYGEQM